MSPIKVMPLLLTAITPFVMMLGVARAVEPQIILAQAQTPQQQEEERKKKAQEKQRAEQQKAQEQQKQSQEQQKALERQKAQEKQRAEQQKAQEQQKQSQEQQKALERQKAQEQEKQRALQQKQPQDQQHKALEQQKTQQPRQTQEQQQKGQGLTDAQKRAQEEARRHEDQAKIQQQQKAALQQQQGRQQQNAPRRELSAEEQKAKAEREAHRLEREKLIARQQQAVANERSQAAVNERLRLQNERLRAITSQRQQSVDRHGQTVIKEPGDRTIIQVNNRVFIQHSETANFGLYGGRVQSARGPSGNTISTIVRPDGVRIEIEVDSYGRPLRRVRIQPDGRRFVLFENRPIEPGIGFALGAFIVELARPRIGIPPDQYIVDASAASEDDIYGALQAPPVEPLDRGYSLEEILASVSLRERMRSVSINSIHFEFGSWEVSPDQAAMLESVAAVIRDMANQNPGEVFLVEGHTDAVGSDVDNLSLSDRRAQSVAEVLSQQFGVPRENLVTQGYGKQFLLIPTDEPEWRNRRVVVRRITPLLQQDSDRYSAGGDAPRDGYRR